MVFPDCEEGIKRKLLLVSPDCEAGDREEAGRGRQGVLGTGLFQGRSAADPHREHPRGAGGRLQSGDLVQTASWLLFVFCSFVLVLLVGQLPCFGCMFHRTIVFAVCFCAFHSVLC